MLFHCCSTATGLQQAVFRHMTCAYAWAVNYKEDMSFKGKGMVLGSGTADE